MKASAKLKSSVITLVLFGIILVFFNLPRSFWQGDWEKRSDMLIIGPDPNEEILDRIFAGGETRERVAEWLGEPVFTFPTSNGEVLIYRTVRQTTSQRERILGLAEMEIYYWSHEDILLVEFVAGRVASHKSVTRSYSRPASEVEFGLNDTLPVFTPSSAYPDAGDRWSTGGER